MESTNNKTFKTVSEKNWLLSFKQFTRSVSSINDFGRLISMAHEFIHEVISAQAFYFGVCKGDSVDWQFIFENNETCSEISEPLDDAVVRAISGKECSIAKDNTGQFKSTIVAPLIVRDEVIGVLVCRSGDRDTYSNQDISLVSLLGVYLGLAWENTRLQNLEKIIEEKEHLKSVVKLAGSVGHELNQPLTGIAGYCALIKEELDASNPIYQDVVEIENQTARLEKLVVKFQTIVDLEKSKRSEMQKSD